MDAWQHWLKRFFPDKEEGGRGSQSPRKVHSLLLLVGLGALLLILNRFDGPEPDALNVQNAGVGLPSPAARRESGYEADLEQRVERLLRSMRGVGDVEVMITLDSSGAQVFAMERTEERSYATSGEAGDRFVTEERLTERPVLIREEQGRTERPLIVTTYQPQVRGVVVLAEGAYDPSLRYELSKVVQALLGVPAHRVQIYAKE